MKTNEPINDYTNPIVWIISFVALIIPFGIILIFKIEFNDPFFPVVIGMMVILIIWAGLWEAYKRSSHYKSRYLKNE